MGDDSFTLYGSGDEQVAGICSNRGRAGEGNCRLSPGEGNGMPLPAPAGFLLPFSAGSICDLRNISLPAEVNGLRRRATLRAPARSSGSRWPACPPPSTSRYLQFR